MNTNQIAVSFGPAPGADTTRKPVVRKGWQKRYSDVLDYLRAELSPGGWSMIDSTEVAKAFNVTATFMTLCVKIGALEQSGKKLSERSYKATDKLATVTAQELRDFRLDSFPNPPYVLPEHLKGKSPGQVRAFADAMNTIAMPTSQLINLDEQADLPTYLIGMITSDGVLEAGTMPNQQFRSREEVDSFLPAFSNHVNRKIVILQVMDVFESRITMQPAAL